MRLLLYTNQLLLIILLNVTSVSFSQSSKSLNFLIKDKELNTKEINLGYKKISVATYKLLKQENEEAKIVYEKMTSHPKRITQKLGENEQFMNELNQYKQIHLSYDSRNIQLNSLFLKTIIENPKIHYVRFSPKEAFLYTDIDVNVDMLNTQLNDVSFAPIIVTNNFSIK